MASSWTLVTPSRWMTGGRGLDNFRKENISDEHYSQIYDYENDRDIFPNNDISGGVMISVWNENHTGKLDYYFNDGKETTHTKRLLDTGDGIVVRDYQASLIIAKIDLSNPFSLVVSARKPYGLASDTTRKNPSWFSETKNENFNICFYCWDGVPMVKYTSEKHLQNKETIKQYKVFISKTAAPPIIHGKENKDILRKPFLGIPNSACSETYLIINPCDTETEANNTLKYIKTKFLRFLVLQRKKTQNVSRTVFDSVPLQDFTNNSDIDWSKTINEIDQQLYKKYGLSEDEIKFIEEKVKEME